MRFPSGGLSVRRPRYQCEPAACRPTAVSAVDCACLAAYANASSHLRQTQPCPGRVQDLASSTVRIYRLCTHHFSASASRWEGSLCDILSRRECAVSPVSLPMRAGLRLRIGVSRRIVSCWRHSGCVESRCNHRSAGRWRADVLTCWSIVGVTRTWLATPGADQPVHVRRRYYTRHVEGVWETLQHTRCTPSRIAIAWLRNVCLANSTEKRRMNNLYENNHLKYVWENEGDTRMTSHLYEDTLVDIFKMYACKNDRGIIPANNWFTSATLQKENISW